MTKPLFTYADLDNCIFFQTVVQVSFGGEVADEGLVQDYTDESVKINGWHYLRCNCTIIKCGALDVLYLGGHRFYPHLFTI